MMMLDDIIAADTSINNWYRESGLPRPIRILVAKHKRNQLKKNTLMYNGLVMEYNDIMSFLVTCRSINPPDGAFMYIKKIVEYRAKGETHYAVSMMVEDNEEEETLFGRDSRRISYTIDMMNDREQTMDIKIVMEGVNGKRSYHTTRTNLEVLEDGDPATELLIDNCNDMFIHMIIQTLMDVFDRSERVYDL